MKKLDRTHKLTYETLTSLLNERKGPISASRQQELSILIAQALVHEGIFAMLAVVKEAFKEDSEVPAEDVIEAPFLLTDDGKYLPLFTDLANMSIVGITQKAEQEIYAVDLTDIISFLDHNEHSDGVVIDPGIHDLILTNSFLKVLLKTLS